MVWGCMTSQDTGYACWVQGWMNADTYVSILDDELLNTIEYYKLKWKKLIFQHDLSSVHDSKKVRDWFKEHKIKVLDWPSQSPDVNLIKHLWDHLKRKLARYGKEPKGVHEIWKHVEKEWNEIPVDVCSTLIGSMQKHVKAMKRAKGGYTYYQ